MLSPVVVSMKNPDFLSGVEVSDSVRRVIEESKTMPDIGIVNIPAPVLPPDPLEAEVKRLRQELSEFHAKEDERRKLEAAQSDKDRKRDICLQFVGVTYGVALTILFQHRHDVVQFINVLIDQVLSFLASHIG
jgi:hypothetical protein